MRLRLRALALVLAVAAVPARSLALAAEPEPAPLPKMAGASPYVSPDPAWVLADAAVATVDQHVVTLSDVVAETIILRWMGQGGKGISQEQVAQTLVRRRLLVLQAEKLRIAAAPEEIATEVQYVAEAGGASSVFWDSMATLGLHRTDVEKRASDLIVMRKYMDLKRQSTYVPEPEVRDFYGEHLDVYGGRPLALVRDEIRERLASQKSAAQLEEWIEKQMKQGRVRMVLREEE